MMLVALNYFRLNFSQLNEHKFQLNIQDKIDPMCSYGLEPKTTFHCLLRCNVYSALRVEPLNNVCSYTPSLNSSSNNNL